MRTHLSIASLNEIVFMVFLNYVIQFKLCTVFGFFRVPSLFFTVFVWYFFFCLCVCSSSSQECNKFVIEKEHELECELFEREIEKNSEKKDIRRVVKWF